MPLSRRTSFSSAKLYEVLSHNQFNKKITAETLGVSLFLLNVILKQAKLAGMEELKDITEDKFTDRFDKDSDITYMQPSLLEMPFADLHQGILELGAAKIALILEVKEEYLAHYLKRVAAKFQIATEVLLNPNSAELVKEQLKQEYNTTPFPKRDLSKCNWEMFHLAIWSNTNTLADIEMDWGLDAEQLVACVKKAGFALYLFRIYSPFILHKYLGEFYTKSMEEVRDIVDYTKLDAEAIVECVKDTSLESARQLFNLDKSFELSSFVKDYLIKRNPSLADEHFSQVSDLRLEEIVKTGDYVNQKSEAIRLLEIVPPLMGEREMGYFSMFPPAKKGKPGEDVLAFMKRLNYQP